MKEHITAIEPREALKVAVKVVKALADYTGLNMRLYRVSNGHSIQYQTESFAVRKDKTFEESYVKVDHDISKIMTNCGVLAYDIKYQEIPIGNDQKTGMKVYDWVVDLCFDIPIIMAGGREN